MANNIKENFYSNHTNFWSPRKRRGGPYITQEGGKQAEHSCSTEKGGYSPPIKFPTLKVAERLEKKTVHKTDVKQRVRGQMKKCTANLCLKRKTRLFVG